MLLADNSVVVVYMESGKNFMWYELDLSSLDQDDTIVDLQPTTGVQDPFFALLTKHGKLLIYHYTIVDSTVSHKKYGRHMMTNDT